MTLVENSSRCPTNNEGEKVVPGELPWIVDLAEKVRHWQSPPFSPSPQLPSITSAACCRHCHLWRACLCKSLRGGSRSHEPCTAITAAPSALAARPSQLAEVALNISPFHYDAAAAAKASNPNRRRKWLIPLVLFAQVDWQKKWGGASCRGMHMLRLRQVTDGPELTLCHGAPGCAQATARPGDRG